MNNLTKLFPKLRKTSHKITGFSAPFGVEITQEIRKLGGTLTERGHVPGGTCNDESCKEYHCPSWKLPIGATMYELVHHNKDGYYVVVLKNGREVLLEKRGGEGTTSLKVCKLNEIPSNLMDRIKREYS